MKRHYIYLLILIVSINVGFSQTPINDLNWDIPCFEDNFDAAPLNRNKWLTAPPWGTCIEVEAEGTDPNDGGNEHIFTNGILNLISRNDPGRCFMWEQMINGTMTKVYHNKDYKTGTILTKDTFKYGYFETSIKLPQLDNITQTGKGFGPAFFLWPIYGYEGTNLIWSEIDIFEIDAYHNIYTYNIHYEDSTIDNHHDLPTWSVSKELGIILDPRISNPFWNPIDFNTFHKIACEWSPTHIKFYLDDNLVFSTHCRYADKLIPMSVWLEILTPTSTRSFEPNTLFPYAMEVDYVKVYKLKMDCDNDFYSRFGYANFDHAVKRYIELSSPIPMRQNFSFRATQSIDLNEGFEVPLGSSVYIDNNVCE